VDGFERTERNLAVAKRRLSGLSESCAAAEFGVSERQIRRILQAYKASRPRLEDLDAEGVVLDTLDAYAEAIEQLAELAATSRHDGARLEAVRAQMEVHAARMGLLQAVGGLPGDLGRFQVEIDLRQAARTVVEIFDRRGIPEEVQAEVVQAIEGRTA